MKIVIIGTGNVATVFGRMFKKKGFEIAQVFGRNISTAGTLAKELDSEPCHSWDALYRKGDMYIVAITDKALYELDQHLVLTNQVVIHTAGSVSREVLKGITSNYGILYPIQSLRKEMPVLTEIPLLVDAANEETLEKILELGNHISHNISLADDEKRLKMHVAAVCINNFSNHLYAMAEDFCRKENVDFNLLLPLAAETVRRIERVSPKQVLTGPAIRNDQVTINRHLEILQSHPLFHQLYEQMSSSIREFIETQKLK